MPGYCIAYHIEVSGSSEKDLNENYDTGMSNHSTFTNVSLYNKNSLPIHLNNKELQPEKKSPRSGILTKTVKRKHLILSETIVLKTIDNSIIKNKALEKCSCISMPVQNLIQTDNNPAKPIKKWQMLLLFCIVGFLLAFLGWGIMGLLTAFLIMGIAVVLAFLILILLLGSIGDSAWG